ncbi:hypothetical protein SAMN04487934_11080 [Eubacterium ruminantium]|nr:hypothetical protein SAMN04487934_11080 [Eubacterium ruminantium]
MMKDEELEKLNITPEEIAEVEALYEAALKNEVPDIWDRIEEGLDKIEADTEAENSSNVISLADRKRRKKTIFTISMAAAAVLIVLVPMLVFGGTLNDRKKSSNDTITATESAGSNNGSKSKGRTEGARDAENDHLNYNGVANEKDAGDERADSADINSLSGIADDDQKTEAGAQMSEEAPVSGKSELAVEPGTVLDGESFKGGFYKENGKYFFETDNKEVYEIVNPEIFSDADIKKMSGKERLRAVVSARITTEDKLFIVSYLYTN